MDLTREESSLQSGSLFAGRYVIERLIGLGGMGEVYLASDSLLENENVALKVIHADLSSDEKNVKRFQREIQLTRKIAHENIARTFDGGIESGRFYFSMEYLQGQELSELLKSGPLPPIESCQIIKQVCAGLAAIHKEGVIHRDLKPANLMLLANGLIKIMDFGIARPGNSALTRTTEVLGSAPYMAPELWTGSELGPSSDLYALGAMFFELLTGVLPLDGDTAAELMFKHLEIMPPAPSIVDPRVPQWIDQIVLTLMSKDSRSRYASSEEVCVAIAQGMSQSKIEETLDEYQRPEVFDEDSSLMAPAVEISVGDKGKDVDSNQVASSAGMSRSLVNIAVSGSKFFAYLLVAVFFYLSIQKILSPYLTYSFMEGQGAPLWYVRVLVTIGYLVTLGLFASLPLLLVSAPVTRLKDASELFVTVLARYSMVAGGVLVLNAVAFLAFFGIDSQHTLGPYLLVVLRHVISGMGQIFLLVPPVDWTDAVRVGGRIVINSPEYISGMACILMLIAITVVYVFYISHITGLLITVHAKRVNYSLAALLSCIIAAEVVTLSQLELNHAESFSIVRIGVVHFSYSAEALLCGGLNWGFLLLLAGFMKFLTSRS